MPLSAKNDEPLAFPINGKTYVVPPVSIDDGLEILRLLALTDEERGKAGVDDVTFFRLALGPVFDELAKDKVSSVLTFRAGMTALEYFKTDNNLEAAEQMWESGINPELLAALMAAMENAKTIEAGSAADAASTASTSGTRKRTPARRAASSTSSKKSQT